VLCGWCGGSATGNDTYQNELATWMEVRTLHKQQNSHIQNKQTPWTLVHKQTSPTFGIQLWGSASTSNIEILECFQSKVLCTIVDASWHMWNVVIQRDLRTPTVKEEICHYSSQYSVRLSVHPNDLVVNLMAQPNNR
jgi:hypothetical protein